MPMMASRGCPYQCTFCSNPSMWTTRWIPRDPDLLLDEMQFYQKKYGAENFDFYDLTAIVKKSWIVDFCRKIEERGLSFTWQLPSGTRTEAIDGEVASLLYRSGCRNMSYSPESGSPAVLRRIKKKIHPDSVIGSISEATKNGMNIKCNIIFGFPVRLLVKGRVILLLCVWRWPGHLMSAYGHFRHIQDQNYLPKSRVKIDSKWMINIMIA